LSLFNWTSAISRVEIFFFVFKGAVNDVKSGKTIHDTRHTFEVSHHYGENFIDLSKNDKPEIKLINTNVSHFDEADLLEYDIAHTAHFGKELSKSYLHFKRMPFSSLHFDVNYFNCFFLPVFNKLKTFEKG
jgi:hypothetical protein